MEDSKRRWSLLNYCAITLAAAPSSFETGTIVQVEATTGALQGSSDLVFTDIPVVLFDCFRSPNPATETCTQLPPAEITETCLDSLQVSAYFFFCKYSNIVCAYLMCRTLQRRVLPQRTVWEKPEAVRFTVETHRRVWERRCCSARQSRADGKRTQSRPDCLCVRVTNTFRPPQRGLLISPAAF